MCKKIPCFCNNHNTILIVDSDVASYLLVSELLVEFNINVLHAKCGVSALEILTKNPQITLIFTELRLPQLDGFKLLERIREMNPNIPVIAQTACNVPGIQQKCIHLGFKNYILKPIDLDYFINITKENLSFLLNKN